ncbi:MAG: phosphomannomutase/phosphoglucomutase [Thermaerobacter sp.]|nr:phosphomannomutase/phosphoglucomutase [Thermaerobacter sp.]
MELAPELFRQYDIRGHVGQDLTADAAHQIALGTAAYFLRHQETICVVGRDCRLSSPQLHDAFVQGLLDGGMEEIVDLGMVPTPFVYFARHHLGIGPAAMITGSHNPPEMNGFKLALGPGTLYGQEIQDVQALAHAASPHPANGKVRSVDIFPAYRAKMSELFPQGMQGLQVVADAGNGAGGPYAPTVLRDLGMDVQDLFCEPDGRFPNHHPDPLQPKNMVALQEVVRQQHADLGFAFDGDMDRLGVVDDEGQVRAVDELLIVYWRDIYPRHPKTRTLVEVKCSNRLVDDLIRLGARPEFTPTGHSLIKARMREVGAVFAGELSGHIFFADRFTGDDDALYAALRLGEIVAQSGRSLRSLLADLPPSFATPETRVHCAESEKWRVTGAVTSRFEGRFPVVTVDGVRVQFPHAWALLRASNTEPALVLRAEGETELDLQQAKGEMEAALKGLDGVGRLEW